MNNIIVISGKQYSGKDTLAKILLEKSRTKVLLTPKEIVSYIKTALKKDPKVLIKILIKEKQILIFIVLFRSSY